MSEQLWTPHGTVNLERSVVGISRDEMRLLAALEKFATDHGIVIYCKGCEKPIQGHNSNTDRVLAVACACREFRYVAPGI